MSLEPWLLDILQCPRCQSTDLTEGEDSLTCRGCDSIYPIVDGVLDMRVDPD